MDAGVHVVSGLVAGAVSVTLDYPLDTMKTRMQVYAHRHYSACAQCLYREGGLRAFYRGLPLPLAAQGIENAIIFSVYHTALDWQQQQRKQRRDHHLYGAGNQRNVRTESSAESLREHAAASAAAGAVVSLVLTPVELIKCNQQSVGWGGGGYSDLCRRIYYKDGLCGFYRGHTGTMARAVAGNITYFLTYAHAKRALGIVSPEANAAGACPVPAWKSMLAGGVSGAAYWSVLFPVDVAKTRMQVDPRFASSGLFGTLRTLYRQGGAAVLYRGWGITVLRAFPSCGVVFTVYEWCSCYLRQQQRRWTPSELEMPCAA